ncbi:PAS domain-containing protein [Paracraurococcus ruber]|uniref:PAS domain S-box-containing protein n=1 Tax=Paracraurococcus ruber TaxID=77675 RepID=A0ABS1D847_9PROT|nr:PAS domain S-box protein [Paracraurococcus ruber]MBK1662510.1 hypothetical protein [Paracraurococcus ruber]TDG11228.1 PAS domain S-box protein [Paracraurococcus ruber]
MNGPRRRHFSGRFLLWTLPALLVVNLAVSSILAARLCLDGIAAIERRAAVILPDLAAAAADPLWTFRTEEVQALMRSVIADPDIVAASILNDRGQAVFAWTAAAAPRWRQREHRHPITYRDQHLTVPVGEIRLTTAADRALGHALAAVAREFGLALASSLIVLLGGLLATRRLLVRPLGTLIAALHGARYGAPRGQVPVAPGTVEEVGAVVAAFNAMQRRLDAGEAERQAATARLLRHYDHTPALLYSVDRQGIIRHASAHWLRATGHARDSVIGRPLAAFLDPESADRYARAILPDFLRTGRTQETPLRLLRRDGSAADVLLSESADTDPADGEIRSVSVMADVTSLSVHPGTW